MVSGCRRGGVRRLAVGCLCLALAPTTAAGGTKTTTYTYNVDGALTSVTTEDGSGGTERRYLTWDNFTPNADDPTSGTVASANGNIRAMGDAPGGAQQFFFDARDRLTGVRPPAAQDGPNYAYHADSILSRSDIADDSLSFYHGPGRFPQTLNERHAGADLMSARLGQGRYLSDGREQVLLLPRKDVGAVLHPREGALETYGYDIFGSEADADGVAPLRAPEDGYDLGENAHRYAGEYRDPHWGGYYLRARWYHPDLPSFISRDPLQNLNRFAYAGGNPLMHVDPGGTNFFHSLEQGVQAVNDALNKGAGGHFARFFLAPLMPPLAIAADPAGFWDAVEHNRGGIDVILALGVLSEFVGGYFDSQAVAGITSMRRSFRLRFRNFSDVVLGGSTSFGQAASHGFSQFDWKTFTSGVEMTAGTSLWARDVAGLNVRSGYKSGADMVRHINELHAGPNDVALIFRVREQLPGVQSRLSKFPIKDSPFQDAWGLGVYHEKLVAVTKYAGHDNHLTTEAFNSGMRRNWGNYSHADTVSNLTSSVKKYELVARIENFHGQNFHVNPRNLLSAGGDSSINPAATAGTSRYRVLWNNCHHHAFSVLKSLGVR